jgi:hypothetical protein
MTSTYLPGMINVIVRKTFLEAVLAQVLFFRRGFDALPPYFSDYICPILLWFMENPAKCFLIELNSLQVFES